MPDLDIVIPGYEILGVIGEGGMGTVYRARQLSLDRLVAIKVLKPLIAKDAEYTSKFIAEARIAAKLTHPNIVQAIEAGESQGVWFFVMELVEAGSLHDRLQRTGKLKELEAIDFGIQITSALEYVTRKSNMVHRDIKPANILLTSDGLAKLADLGLARRQGVAESSGFAEGTPQYCSPEQCRAEPHIDTRSDLYALGATLYHLVCGKPPFDGDEPAKVMGMQIHSTPEPPRKHTPELTPGFESMILKLLAKNPAERFQTPAELQTELERLRALMTGHKPGPTITPHGHRPLPQKQKKRSLMPAIATIVVALAVFGYAGHRFFQKSRPPAKAPKAAAAKHPAKPVVPATATNAVAAAQPAAQTNAAPVVAASNAVASAVTAPAPMQEEEPVRGKPPIRAAKVLKDIEALRQEKKFAEAETELVSSIAMLTNFPAASAKLQIALAEVRRDIEAVKQREAEEAAAKAAAMAAAEKAIAEKARQEQLDLQARAAVAPVDPLVRTLSFERAHKYLLDVIAKSADADFRTRIQARADDLQLLLELKSRFADAASKGTIPERTLLLRTGGSITGRPATVSADSLSISISGGVGSVTLPWTKFSDQTLYELLQLSVTAKDGRGLAAMALFAWDVGRAQDAKRYFDVARAVLGEANLPAVVKRRAAS